MYIPLTFEATQGKCLIASSSIAGTFISGGFQYEYHVFNSSSNFEVYNGTLEAQLLIVGGGGGGAFKTGGGAGGGGGAQVVYLPSQRFYTGTYGITIGDGGDGALNSGSAHQGFNGESTTISGVNFTLSAIGGQGATGSTGGTSGDLYVGGTGYDAGAAEGGGGGGGSRGIGQSVSSLTPTDAGDGGVGFYISIANYTDGYGCGGGGGSSAGGNANGFSCNGTYGMGGGNVAGVGADAVTNRGGGGGGGYYGGGNGGSGVVIIQYKVNDYCKNFYYETGSCDCRILNMDTTDTGSYNLYETGSYIYLPCNGTEYVTGSLKEYYPQSVCAAYNSYYAYTTPYPNIDEQSALVYSGIINSTFTSECSIGNACVNTSSVYTPNCLDSRVMAFINYSIHQPAQGYYVGANSGSISNINVAVEDINYVCAVTASGYPIGILGGISKYGNASCTQYNFSGTLPAGGSNTTVTYWQCGGTKVVDYYESGRFTPRTINTNFCADTSFGTPSVSTTTGTPGTLTSGGNCLTGSLLPACGCP